MNQKKYPKLSPKTQSNPNTNPKLLSSLSPLPPYHWRSSHEASKITNELRNVWSQGRSWSSLWTLGWMGGGRCKGTRARRRKLAEPKDHNRRSLGAADVGKEQRFWWKQMHGRLGEAYIWKLGIKINGICYFFPNFWNYAIIFNYCIRVYHLVQFLEIDCVLNINQYLTKG